MIHRGRSDDANVGLYCTFRLASRLFGVNVLDVKEISAAATFTTIPHAPPEVYGYVSLRGQIHLLLDLRQMLGLKPAELTNASRLILFKPSISDAFGVLVDTVGDIIQLGGDQIEPRAPGDGQEGGDLLAGVGELEDELVILLEPRRFLSALQRPSRTQPHGMLTSPDRR